MNFFFYFLYRADRETDSLLQTTMINMTFKSIGGSRWGPYSQLPAGEVQGCPPEPWREELPHILPAGGRW